MAGIRYFEEEVTETAPAFTSWDAEEQVSVYRDSMDSTESVTVYLLDDIAYMKIDEFHNRLHFTGAEDFPEKASPMAVTHEGGVYEAYAFDGAKAAFYVDMDTFTRSILQAPNVRDADEGYHAFTQDVRSDAVRPSTTTTAASTRTLYAHPESSRISQSIREVGLD